MKTFSIRCMAVLGICIMIAVSCKKDDPAPAATLSTATLTGTWVVTYSEGTEWKEGTGIITPRAAAPDLLGFKFEFTATTLTVKDASGTVLLGPIAYTLTASTGI